MKKRVAKNKPLERQEFESFADWRSAETGVIEKAMNEHSLKREFKGSHTCLDNNEYKR